MKKIYLVLLISLMANNLQSQSVLINLMPGTDMFIYARGYQDSIVYNYSGYEIKTLNSTGMTGHDIVITDSNNQTTKIENDWALYFFGLIDNYMVVDIGTGPSRKFKIYNLHNMEVLFESRYEGNIEAVNNLIHFYTSVRLSEEDSLKIDCPDKEKMKGSGMTLIYIEKQIFNLDTKELLKTGDIQCTYVS